MSEANPAKDAPWKQASAAPLFRPEVAAGRDAQWLGEIRLGRAPSFGFLAAIAFVIAAALIVFACWAEVTRKVTAHGVLLPTGGLINVASQQAGVVGAVLVNEGDEVQSGQPLVRLTTARVTESGDAAQLTAQAFGARRSALESERRLAEQNMQQRVESLNQRMLSLQSEHRQSSAEVDTHRLRLQLSKKSLDRQQQLQREGFVAAAQVQQAQEELLDLQLRERNADRNVQALHREIVAVSAERQAMQIQARTTFAQLDRSLAALRQEMTEADGRNGVIAIAPQKSRVTAVMLSLGQSVQPGQTLVSLVPLGDDSDKGVNPAELQAQLFAPSRTAGFVRAGQKAWLRYTAFPYQKFGVAIGEIVSVSRSPIAPQDLPNGHAQALLAAVQSNEPMYRIIVKLPAQVVDAYGNSLPLSAGMSLQADIRQESRKVYEWFFEPLIAVARRGV